MTHNELTELAYKYCISLNSGLGCVSAITEARLKGSIAVKGYRPDVLGWRLPDTSIAIECKTSRADSRAELDKGYHSPLRMDERIGNLAYIFSPVDVQVIVPEGYGHLVTDGRVVWESGEPTYRMPVNRVYEAALAFCALCSANVPDAIQYARRGVTAPMRATIQEEALANGGMITVERARKISGQKRSDIKCLYAGKIVTIGGRDMIAFK